MWKKFNIESAVEQVDDLSIQIVRVKGYLDSSTFPELSDHLESLISNDEYRILVEFGELDYISSAGLGVLMGMLQQVRQNHGDLKLVNMSSKIRNLFDMLGFSRLIRIYDTMDEAKQAFLEERNVPVEPEGEANAEDSY